MVTVTSRKFSSVSRYGKSCALEQWCDTPELGHSLATSSKSATWAAAKVLFMRQTDLLIKCSGSLEGPSQDNAMLQ